MVKHLAIMMDGNRRWAKKNGLISNLGHYHGVQASKRAINFCLQENIPILSLYTFSLENLKRSETEKNYLFGLILDLAEKQLDEFIQKGVKINFVGDRDLFHESVKNTCESIEQKTAHLNKLTLNLLFYYGSRQEIVACTKKLVQDALAGKISLDDITTEKFEQNLWTGNTPDPEIILRTGGQQRMSNFMLYQAAYCELIFTDKLWPDMQNEDFKEAINEFNTRKRNFGI